MWSIGAAVLVEVALCVAAVAWAQRRLRAELEPTRTSCDRLHDEVARAVPLVARDTGRATAAKLLLLRRGDAPGSR